MTTKKIINGKQVTIDWEFEEVNEILRSDWYEWNVTGQEKHGSRKFTGNCQAHSEDPEHMHDVEGVTNIEEVEYDPTPWEADYGAPNAAERQEQMASYQKLK